MVCIVVGGGVIGLAAARRLARRGSVFVLERAAWLAPDQSSRNSEVVHAGLYYPPGSLKARACKVGARMLTEYCDRRGIAWARRGKIIVGSGEEGRD